MIIKTIITQQCLSSLGAHRPYLQAGLTPACRVSVCSLVCVLSEHVAIVIYYVQLYVVNTLQLRAVQLRLSATWNAGVTGRPYHVLDSTCGSNWPGKQSRRLESYTSHSSKVERCTHVFKVKRTCRNDVFARGHSGTRTPL